MYIHVSKQSHYVRGQQLPIINHGNSPRAWDYGDNVRDSIINANFFSHVVNM